MATTTPPQRHRYTPSELTQYFDRICLPQHERHTTVKDLSDAQKLAFLNVLQKHHLTKCPWENISQHYSWHHTVHLSAEHLFSKIVSNPGRGGYCMEVNYFQHMILYSLDFETYMCGSKIFRPGKVSYFGEYSHVVNIVSIAGKKYMLDGGYSHMGPPRPILLSHDQVQAQIAPAEMRLLHAPLPQNLNQEQKFWIFQHRISADKEWENGYCFPDLEFTPKDVHGMNFVPACSRSSVFTHKVLVVRFSTAGEVQGGDDEEGKGPGSPGEAAMQGEITGAVTLYHDVLKWRRQGKKVVHLKLKNEEERIKALEMYFGVVLDKEEREGILGGAAMIDAEGFED